MNMLSPLPGPYRNGEDIPVYMQGTAEMRSLAMAHPMSPHPSPRPEGQPKGKGESPHHPGTDTYQEVQAFPFLNHFQPQQLFSPVLQDLHVSLEFLLSGEETSCWCTFFLQLVHPSTLIPPIQVYLPQTQILPCLMTQ